MASTRLQLSAVLPSLDYCREFKMTAGAVAVPTIIPLRVPVPGVPKAAVDTDTKIELHSETPGATIYYTLNSEKPDPFGGVSPAAKATLVYRGPFLLPGGKRTIKAIAVSQDKRESFVVTKVFDVHPLESSDLSRQTLASDSAFADSQSLRENVKREVQKFANEMVTGREAWAEVQRNKNSERSFRGERDAYANASGSGRRQFPAEPRFLNGRFGSNGRRPLADENGIEHYRESDREIASDYYQRKWRPLPDDASQALRLQKETDFLRCSHCFAPRPSDPFVRFCNDCGQPIPPLPQVKLPPPAPEQMGSCGHCGTSVPLNLPNCLVCEAPLRPQNVPGRMEEKVICTKCGSSNPSNFRSCVGCTALLPATRQRNQQRILSALSEAYVGSSGSGSGSGSGESAAVTKGQMLVCTQCGRVNNPDARFCDWCGTKSSANLSSPIFCSKCRASNNANAQFCNSCGVVLLAPMRNGLSEKLSSSAFPLNFSLRAGEPWMPVNLASDPLRLRSDATTQTVGLFFPSEKTLRHVNHDIEEKRSVEKELRDRKPMLTAISPGRGYWRKQLEHVCAHLKAHASNDADFRALIGEPRMGKLLSAIVNEDGYELNLTLNFVLREPAIDDGVSDKQRLTEADEFLKSVAMRQRPMTHRSHEEGVSLNSGRVSSGRKKISTKSTKRPKKFLEEETVSAINRKLLKELGKTEDGRLEIVSQLIQEGADPNCVDRDGVPVLFVAALNKHIDALPLLIQEGAKVNQTGPNRGNTVLHEVVGLGNSAVKVVEVLLGCGANPSKKNDRNETAYDLAVKSGCDSVAKKLAAHIGQSALIKLVKPRLDQDDAY